MHPEKRCVASKDIHNDMVGTFGNDIPISPKIKIWRINIGVSIENDPRSRDCRHRGKH